MKLFRKKKTRTATSSKGITVKSSVGKVNEPKTDDTVLDSDGVSTDGTSQTSQEAASAKGKIVVNEPSKKQVETKKTRSGKEGTPKSSNSTVVTNKAPKESEAATSKGFIKRLRKGNAPLTKKDKKNEGLPVSVAIESQPEPLTVDISRLIKQKHKSPKQNSTPSDFKPLKANRPRPAPMSMSKRNEDHFQKYVERQNMARRARAQAHAL